VVSQLLNVVTQDLDWLLPEHVLHEPHDVLTVHVDPPDGIVTVTVMLLLFVFPARSVAIAVTVLVPATSVTVAEYDPDDSVADTPFTVTLAMFVSL
jgi:hypothetical protein